MSYDKALVNAIIHDGLDPSTRVTIICCEKCKNPFLWELYRNDAITTDEFGRISMAITQCPDCGSKEMNVTGTYLLPEILPGDILKFIGHFMSFQTYMASRIDMATGIIRDEE